MTPEARAAAYALAEHLWRDHDPSRVDVLTDLWNPPRVNVQLVRTPTRDAAEGLIRHLEGTVTDRKTTTEGTAWVVGVVIRDGQTIQVTVIHAPEPADQGEESGR